MKEIMKSMKTSLLSMAQSQMNHLDQVDAEELGEVIDMIKDLEEALYYCAITEAMEQKEKEGQGDHSRYTSIYYSEPMMYPQGYNRMYYDGTTSYRMYDNGGNNNAQGNNGSSSRMYADGGRNSNGGDNHRGYSDDMRDPREGNSHTQRRMYMESKQMHQGKAKQLQELEKYVKELSDDLIEMVEDASPEERQYLGNRMASLATKINKIND